MGIAQKDPTEQSGVPSQLTWHLPLQPEARDRRVQKEAQFLLPHAVTGWGKLDKGKLQSTLCATRNCVLSN